MNSKIPDRQLVEWGMKRLQLHHSALRGVNDMLRMSRHGGRAYIRPVRPDRTVLVYQPFNRFLQPAIMQCGRTRITNELGFGAHVALGFRTKHGDDTIRVIGTPIAPFVDAVGRECFVIVEPQLFVDGVLDMPEVG